MVKKLVKQKSIKRPKKAKVEVHHYQKPRHPVTLEEFLLKETMKVSPTEKEGTTRESSQKMSPSGEEKATREISSMMSPSSSEKAY
ncbi:hypothetical protein KY284_032514 [Solanum tuberosum]|nr:hypothetical protein KY284_032514 [Solanum tuberosum]